MILTLIELLFFQWSCKWLHSSTKVGNNFPWQFLKLRSISSRTSCVGFSLLFCSILVLILRAEPRSNYFSYISHHKKIRKHFELQLSYSNTVFFFADLKYEKQRQTGKQNTDDRCWFAKGKYLYRDERRMWRLDETTCRAHVDRWWLFARRLRDGSTKQ